MACRLFGAKPLSKSMLDYCLLDSKEQTSVKFNQNTKIFIHENAPEDIVCEMAAILSRGRWVKPSSAYSLCTMRLQLVSTLPILLDASHLYFPASFRTVSWITNTDVPALLAISYLSLWEISRPSRDHEILASGSPRSILHSKTASVGETTVRSIRSSRRVGAAPTGNGQWWWELLKCPKILNNATWSEKTV